MRDIAKIDKNFEVKTKIGKDDVVYRNVLEEPFRVYGVFHEDGKFRRLPEAVAKTVSEGVLALHANCAGGRVRFRTNSKYVAIYAELENIGRMPHFPLTGAAGFDIYADYGVPDRFLMTFVPPYDMVDSYESVCNLFTAEDREVTINFPLYTDVKNLYIGVSKDAYIEAPKPYRVEKPVVYYGSSVTQGGCASRPGNAYQAVISRRLSCDHINLGFSGVAQAELEIANYIRDLDMSAFVFDYDHNAPSFEHLEKTHERMYKIIREAHPDIPIIFASKPKYLNDLYTERWFADQYGLDAENIKTLDDEANFGLTRTLEIIQKTYKNAIAAGDKNVYLIPGGELMKYCDHDGTVDICHPTDYGFASMARVFGDLLAKVL